MRHPYIGLPDQQFWNSEEGIVDHSKLDPVSVPPFKIKRSDRIVTAGSCFAQHVARFMSEAGFNHFIPEAAHPIASSDLAKKYNYGVYSARYGNIYTARQLNQLLARAYGSFSPRANAWSAKANQGVVDPFRPQIQPGGFLSEKELNADRSFHFKCVRTAIEELDFFVFTLGLTEAWEDTYDGAVFPLAPGVSGGVYEPDKVRFVNFDEEETYADLCEALSFIRNVNPLAKFILTVSPVPLNATYEDRHVLSSTVWSKAVLRIVAEKVTKHFSDCIYFPSFEIITSPHVRGKYFAEDCRAVTQDGVKHVMQLFLKHFTSFAHAPKQTEKAEEVAKMSSEHIADMQETLDVLCDEEALRNR